MTHLEVTGYSEARKFIQHMSKIEPYEKSLEAIVNDTANLMRNFAPVRTGMLESQIKVKKLGTGKYAIIVSVPYAEYMEYGTKYFPVGTPESPRVRSSTLTGKVSYHPFMRFAIYIIDKDFSKYMERILMYRSSSARIG